MGFIDTIIIMLIAGDGGSTVVRYGGGTRAQRRLYVSYGGNGGDIWLITDKQINTLSDFIFKRSFFAENGQSGRARGCRGKAGKSVFIKIPPGTRVYDQDTQVVISDLTNDKQKFMVVKGGAGGFLNRKLYCDRYYSHTIKASRNQLRRVVYGGAAGEKRQIRLELLLLADVGLLGLSNIGKSTFLRCVSSARPKVGDYPFTTLVPSLGVVGVDDDRFVIADLPGIIKGASVGLGLGFSFLKHLRRCRMLLHFVDLGSVEHSEILENIAVVVNELKSYRKNLIVKPTWLIFNKIDLLSIDAANKKVNNIMNTLNWKGRYYLISSKYDYGVKKLCYDLMQFIKYNL